MSNLESLSREELVRRFWESLVKFFNTFAENPFYFFYEEDIRSHLLVHLDKCMNRASEFPIDKRYRSSIHKSVVSSVIKAEYPRLGEASRFDIAFLEPESSDSFYTSRVSIAIEVKLGSEEIGSDKTAGFKQDFRKLKEAWRCAQAEKQPFLGIAIYFHQTCIPIEDKRKLDAWYHDTFQPLQAVSPADLVLEDNTVAGLIVPPAKDVRIFLGKENPSGE